MISPTVVIGWRIEIETCSPYRSGQRKNLTLFVFSPQFTTQSWILADERMPPSGATIRRLFPQLLYGTAVEHVDMSVEEIQNILVRLIGHTLLP
jgi:hypothetical protein